MTMLQLAIVISLLAASTSTRGEYLRNTSDNANRGGRHLSYGGYVSVLHAGEWLRPNQYLVEYDSSGDPVFKFGLDESGMLGLWHDEELVWRPEDNEDGEVVECDKLKFQEANGHLTCYLVYDHPGPSYAIDHKWKSLCKDGDYGIGYGKIRRKITLADGDVNQFDDHGAVVWTLPGSRIYSGEPIEPICRPELVSQ